MTSIDDSHPDSVGGVIEAGLRLMSPKYFLVRIIVSSLLLVAAATILFVSGGLSKLSIFKIPILTSEGLAVLLVWAGILIAFLPLFGRQLLRSFERMRGSDFLEIDRRASRQRGVSAHVEGGDVHIYQTPDIEEAVGRAVAEELRSKEHRGTFAGHFLAISRLLESKADVADEKASILLSRGVAYSWGGVVFYVLSIVVWQWLARDEGMKPRIVVGVASCSLLFIFVEFLSAWFLRQYRHFVDTSTYLIKVKAIFDRYMLAYTLADESGGDVAKKFGALNEMLAATLQWPETQIFTFGDTDFAKEAAAAFPNISNSKATKSE